MAEAQAWPLSGWGLDEERTILAIEKPAQGWSEIQNPVGMECPDLEAKEWREHRLCPQKSIREKIKQNIDVTVSYITLFFWCFLVFFKFGIVSMYYSYQQEKWMFMRHSRKLSNCLNDSFLLHSCISRGLRHYRHSLNICLVDELINIENIAEDYVSYDHGYMKKKNVIKWITLLYIWSQCLLWDMGKLYNLNYILWLQHMGCSAEVTFGDKSHKFDQLEKYSRWKMISWT